MIHVDVQGCSTMRILLPWRQSDIYSFRVVNLFFPPSKTNHVYILIVVVIITISYYNDDHDNYGIYFGLSTYLSVNLHIKLSMNF